MWDELASELEADLEDLATLRSEYADLLSPSATPTRIEVLALSSVLHSFYGGVENALSRIEKGFDRHTAKTASWHANLLRRASQRTDRRPPVLTESRGEYSGSTSVFGM